MSVFKENRFTVHKPLSVFLSIGEHKGQVVEMENSDHSNRILSEYTTNQTAF
jgi:hypothetical protein